MVGGGSCEYKKGLWTMEEDKMLMDYVRVHGKGKWNRIAKITGLKRCGKSCRLRWMNYLSPTVKRGDFSEEESDLIIRLHNLLGNRWSLIAGRVPGRTDNQVKNHWNSHLCKKLGIIKKGKSKPHVHGPSSSAHPDSHRLGGNGSTTVDAQLDSNARSHGDGDHQDRGRGQGQGQDPRGIDRDSGSGRLTSEPFETEEEPTSSEVDIRPDSLWLSGDDLFVCSPNLMDFMNDCLMDFSWDISL